MLAIPQRLRRLSEPADSHDMRGNTAPTTATTFPTTTVDEVARTLAWSRLMPSFFSVTKQYRSRLVAAVQRRRRQRGSVSTESLEQRALLSAVTYDAVTEAAIFNADGGHDNVVTISSPDADTLVIQSQRRDAGFLVDDPITLQGDAFANAGFTLDASMTVLTIDITTAGSVLTDLTVNGFDGDDEIDFQSSAATVETSVNGGSGEDTGTIGTLFRLDSVLGGISFDGGSGSDTLQLLDFNSLTPDAITLDGTTISGMAPADIDHTQTETLLLDTPDLQPVTLDVLSTPAGVSTSVDLTFEDGSGNAVLATVTVGNTDADFNSIPGDMSGILGDLALITNSGALQLQIDNSANPAGDAATIGATSVQNFSPGTVSFTVATNFALLDVLTGDGADDINLTAAPTGVQIDTGDGDDLIIGSEFDDLLLGGPGNDSIDGAGGDDFIDGDVGDDLLAGGDGNDLILGFDGDDEIDGGLGNDELLGESGVDLILGGDGNDLIEGGDASDMLGGGPGDDLLFGGPGEDVLRGGSGSDVLSGGNENDLLFGNGGGDNLLGDLGDDTINAGGGRDVITWNLGDGNDLVDGGEPAGPGQVDRQEVIGLGGDDIFEVSAANGSGVVTIGAALVTTDNVEEVRVLGAGGNDLVLAGDLTGTDVQKVVVFGNEGDDRVEAEGLTGATGEFVGGPGDDVLFGGVGDDVLKGGTGRDSLVGGPGNDFINGASGDDEIVWNNGDGTDVVNGGAGSDLLLVDSNGADDDFAITMGVDGTMVTRTSPVVATITFTELENLNLDTNAGNDTVLVGDLTGSSLETLTVDLAEGDDVLDASNLMVPIPVRGLGGVGKDQLTGGPGDDFLRGAFDKDTLKGGSGADELIGDEGNDSLAGGGGADILNGGAGADILRGKAGDDILLGGGGSDRLEGGADDDFIDGGRGHDRVAGGAGNDIITTGLGSDIITGGNGRDLIIGGRGADDISGNEGQDLIVSGQVDLSENALRQIHAEWIVRSDYEGRTRAITNTIVRPNGKRQVLDPQANGTFLFPITSERNVLDDGDIDQIHGGSGRDLFFADFDLDVIDARLANETQIDLR